MSDAQMRADIASLTRELARLRADLENTRRASGLARSAVDDGALTVTQDGSPTMSVGVQYDGTSTAATVAGPVPPQAATPGAYGVVGGIVVQWSGLFAVGGVTDASIVAPMDFSRVEVHASTDPNFTALYADTIVATFETPRGGEQSIALPSSGEWAVRLVTRSAAGRAAVASDAYFATPLPPPSGGGPTVKPAVSPVPAVYPGPASAMLTWPAVEDPYTIIDLHVSPAVDGEPPSAAPSAATLAAEDVTPIAVVQTYPDKTTPIPNGTDSYFALVARNDLGEAPPSPWVAGRADRLSPEMLVVTVGMLISEGVLTEAISASTIQRGDGTWDERGLRFPGILDIPFDGTPASITVDLEALSATIANLTVIGQSNDFSGGVDLANGVTAPQSPPRVTTSWSHPAMYGPFGTQDRIGVLRGLAEDDEQWYYTESVFDGNVWQSRKSDGEPYLVLTLPDIQLIGGIVRVGNQFVIMGIRNSDSLWLVRRYDLSWNYVGQFAWRPRSGEPAGRHPHLGTDGTNLWIARTAGPAAGSQANRYYVHKYSVSGTYLDGFYGSHSTLLLGAVTGVYVGYGDLSAPYMWMVVGNRIHMMDSQVGTFYTAYQWTGANSEAVLGITYSQGQFHTGSPSGKIWRYAKRPTAVSYDIAYSWYDADPAGLTTGTHETQPGAKRRVTIPARNYALVETATPNDGGKVDDPDSVRIYAAAAGGTLRLQATYAPGVVVNTFDTFDLSTSAPEGRSDNQFANLASSIGELRSVAAFLSGLRIIQLTGDGSGNVGPYSWNSLGQKTDQLGEGITWPATGAQTVSSTVAYTVPGLNQNFAFIAGAVYEVEINAQVSITSAGTVNIVELLVDGDATSPPRQIVTQGPSGLRVNGSQRYHLSGLSGSHNLRASTRNTQASTGATVQGTHSTMTIRRVS